MAIEDIPSVLEIDRVSFPNPWPQSAYSYEIRENRDSRAWVGCCQTLGGEAVCAFAVFWNVLDETHIGTFAVHPDYRGRGIGALFLGNLLKFAQKEGIIRALLEVRESNLSALSLYRRFGFQEDGIRKKYYRDNGESAILMSASLSGSNFPETDPPDC